MPASVGEAMPRAAELRLMAAEIRDNPPNSGRIADALDLIAGAMEPCIDCGHPDMDELPGALGVTGNEDAGV